MEQYAASDDVQMDAHNSMRELSSSPKTSEQRQQSTNGWPCPFSHSHGWPHLVTDAYE
jgi:hypothetical protein